MKGLDLCEGFYREYGEPMLREQFPHLLKHIAVAALGAGSEHLGYDDGISRDHDFSAGFTILLPDEETVSRRDAFLLERAYEKLPREYGGVKRERLSAVGGNRRGVYRLSEFLEARTGTPDGSLTLTALCRLPEQSLLELTRGRVFHDGAGELSRVRAALSYLPEDLRRKKLSGELVLMGQTGEYNLPRALAREDTATARLCLAEFVRHAMHAAFLAESTYMPYYKWQFRALSDLPRMSVLGAPLSGLLACDEPAKTGKRLVKVVCERVLTALAAQSLLPSADVSCEEAGYTVQGHITDPVLRNSHVLYAAD